MHTIDDVWYIEEANVPTSDNIWLQLRPEQQKLLKQFFLITTVHILDVRDNRLRSIILTKTPNIVVLVFVRLESDRDYWMICLVWLWKALVRCNLNINIHNVDKVWIKFDLIRPAFLNELTDIFCVAIDVEAINTSVHLHELLCFTHRVELHGFYTDAIKGFPVGLVLRLSIECRLKLNLLLNG